MSPQNNVKYILNKWLDSIVEKKPVGAICFPQKMMAWTQYALVLSCGNTFTNILSAFSFEPMS